VAEKAKSPDAGPGAPLDRHSHPPTPRIAPDLGGAHPHPGDLKSSRSTSETCSHSPPAG
jgi:hypothetical protein